MNAATESVAVWILKEATERKRKGKDRPTMTFQF
jgi:hypothetical protein